MQERNALFRELMGLGLYDTSTINHLITAEGEISRDIATPKKADSNSTLTNCEEVLQGTESEVLIRANLESYNPKITKNPGVVIKYTDTDTIKDYEITHFDSDDSTLKPAHLDIIDELIKYISDRTSRLDSQGITAKFVIHLQGFASLSNKNRPRHNCLLSWRRRYLTKERFYSAPLGGRIMNLEEQGNLRFVIHDHGFFKAKRAGDIGEERKVRISIGGEDYVRPKIPSQKNPTVFKVHCLELTDYAFPDDEAVNLFMKYFVDIDIELLLTNLLDRITSGHWTRNLDRISDPTVKKVLKEAAKVLLGQLKKRLLNLKVIKNLIKKWKLDKHYSSAKELASALKALLLFINVGIRKGKFVIESLDFSPVQKETFLYVGLYMDVQLPKIPIIDKGISPAIESGDKWTLFRTFTINKDGTRSPYEMTVNSFNGNAYVEIGSRFVINRPKKGFLSFHRLNKHFGYRLNNIILDEFNNRNEVNFKLPSNETTLRFSPSQGVFIKE